MVHSTHADELIRSTVAESMGRLLPVYPQFIGNAIEDGLRSGEPLQKATLAKSVKYGGGKCGDQMMVVMVAEGLISL